MREYKIKTKHEITPLRFASMDCPKCGEGINLMCDARTDDGGRIHDSVDLCFMVVKCRKCKHEFRTRGCKIIEQEG